MPTDKTFDLLRSALRKPGCAICRLEREHIQRYLSGFMYEDVTDVDLRAKMRTAQGFCREHAAQAVLVRDSLGLAIIYQDILTSVGASLRTETARPSVPMRGLLRRGAALGERLARLITPHRPCPACTVREEMTAAALETLIKHLSAADLSAAFGACDGLCLPHLRLALAQTDHQLAATALVERQVAVIARLDRELAEFIRKHDHRFRHETMGDERDSWQRAIDMAVGQPAADT